MVISFMIKKKLWSLLGVNFISSFVLLTFWLLLHGRHEELVQKKFNLLNGPFRLLRSDNISQEPSPYWTDQLTSDDWHHLINVSDFTFMMNGPATLCNVSNPSMVLAVVHSAPRHFPHRKAIRNTWGRDLNVVFLVGETDNFTQQQLHDENTKYNDIVQGSFVDSYRNITYKHVMGLKWITYHCQSARYILKLDDDVFVNWQNLQNLIIRHLSTLGARHLVMCVVSRPIIVPRSYRSKWRVTPAEYAGRWYPKYCPGWAVLYSPDAIFALYREAQRTPYFWVDDIHVTGTLMIHANLTHTNIHSSQRYLWADGKEFLIKHQADFVVGIASYSTFYELWQTLSS